MYANFTVTKRGTWAYIQKSVRDGGKTTTLTIKCLGLLSDIKEAQGCADPRQWVKDLAAKMTRDEREGRAAVSVDFHPGREVPMGDFPLRIGGDVALLPLYNGLGLPEICASVAAGSRAKYDLDEILRTLVAGRVLFPGSKACTLRRARSMVRPPRFSEEEMYRALSLLSVRLDDIQARVYRNSKSLMERRDRVVYYDCSNYYFEIEDNDPDCVDPETGAVSMGLRKRGKSKEHRPSPIVQMGLFMDMDGIPLAFVVFPGNDPEQGTLQPLEGVLKRKFGLTEFVVSTDAGLGSEDNRRYNMAEGRDYICVQSLPSLKEEDRIMAVRPEGWKVAFCPDTARRSRLETELTMDGVLNLDKVLEAESQNPGMLRGVTLYREIRVEKAIKRPNPEWEKLKKAHPESKAFKKDGKPVPKDLTSKRMERLIVTYSHDFALYLKHKRQERLEIAKKMVKNKQSKPRTSQQSPMAYIDITHKTAQGEEAEKVEMAISQETLDQEKMLDGFYAYGTSLEDDAVDVLRIRSLHHEIEHIFRTTKTHLGARPVYLSRQDRIRSHFLICFLAMTILKMLQRQLNQQSQANGGSPVPIDQLVETLRDIKFGVLPNRDYQPMYTRTTLTDSIFDLYRLPLAREIISRKTMNETYRKVNKR